jgi:hypothetical protein
MKIYLDDVRTPKDKDWMVVRNYHEFVNLVQKIVIKNISNISLDHDLGDSAMNEYHTNVSPNFKLDYNNISEKTGYDAAKFLVDEFYSQYPERLEMNHFDKKKEPIMFPIVLVHSANPIGSANMMGYINNFLMNEAKPQTCVRHTIPHTV